MMDVMEFDMGSGGNRGRLPPRIAARLAAGSRSSEAKSTEGRTRAQPPPGRADSKASGPGTMVAKRPGSITTDSIQHARRSDSRTVHRRGSSDDEAAAKPMSRRVPGSPPGSTMSTSGTERRGDSDRGASATTTEERSFRLGQKIEGRYHGKGRWYKGRIIGANPDGTYDVRYEDGDEDLRLNASAIKPVDGVRQDSDATHRTGEAYLPRVGDRIEAKAPGSAGWRAATVVGENRDGSVDVQFRDGTKEKRLEPSLVRVPREEHVGSGSGPKGKSSAGSFRVGDKIEARYRGKSRWFRGVVRRMNSDQTYDIRYADGDQETGVDSSLIRLLDVHGDAGDTRGSTMEDYRVGDKIEARFGGRARWFPAKIERENRDGTFSLLYDDGEVEKAVDKSLLRHVDSNGSRSEGAKYPHRRVLSGVRGDTASGFRGGDKVQARYKRGRKWFTGVIRAVGRDGTYDIRYDDGDTEEGVEPGMVKPIGAGSVGSLSSTAVDKRGEGEFSAGDKVEALYRGRSQWFKATVERRNQDGTYHLIYASGDEERAVGKDMIRTLDDLLPQRGDAKSANHQSPSRNDDQESDAGPSHKLRVGDEIEARYRRGNKWFPGVIRSANRDGTFDVRYKDGDQERDIDPLFIRAKASTRIDSLASSEGDFSKGDKVEARFQGRSRWFKATVERDNRDSTFDLLYQDGGEEKAVRKALIRRHVDDDFQEGTKAGRRKVADRSKIGGNDSDSDVDRYCIGDEIEARYKRGPKWYPGEIRATNRDGTYDIRYKDGDTENDVGAALIRRKDRGSLESLTASTINGEQSDFAEGEQVEARLGGKWRWLKATVERRNRDGSYQIVYMSGEEERAVDKKLIRKLSNDRGLKRPSSSSVSRRAASPRGGIGASRSAKKHICVGDEIESRYKGRREWYPGVIRAVNRDGTYDVHYKDGDIEYDVIPSFVRVTSTTSLTFDDAADDKNARVEYVEGEKVEARFRGHSRWFKARVSKVNRDGTYHLVYDDGDEERSVPKELMRKLGRDTAGDRKDTPNELKKHRVGDKIEARYKRGHKWYAGVILAVNRDGTCDIRYSDGDSERDVEPSFIRNKVMPKVTSSDSMSKVTSPFVEGDEVEARFGGRLRWLKATVERENRDKTYYLRYADGDVERAVEKTLIRRVSSDGLSKSKSPGRHVVSGAESDPDSSAPRSYRIGDDVEARYKRGQKWYPGVVRSVNHGGTYDIRYNDGDSEKNVVSSMIRGVRASQDTLPSTTSLSDGAPADGRAETFAVGEKVEARFGGRSRWFEATVERKNRDGTYYLLYNDGDKERNVERYLIRRVDSGGCRRSGDDLPGRQAKSITEADRADESAGEDLQEGDEIEARYRQGQKWYPGVIRTVNRNGTYSIRYNDGDIEHSVQRASIREKDAGRVDRPASPRILAKNSDNFVAGDEVEARLGGRARWFRATVERKNRDSTYHLLYSDGQEERMVEKELIRRVNRRGNPKADAGNSKREDSDRIACERVNSIDSLASNDSRYRVGDKVEARFRGGSRWFKGTIDGENPDGTFRLLYADGDRERAVHASLIRQLGPNGEEAKVAIGDSVDAAFHVGDAIEARYKRGTRWYPGVVRKANLNGTFDILYKDGDAESGVPMELIRSTVSSSTTTSIAPNEASSFSPGNRVEARYGGGSRWIKATVERKNRNGTYHLVYDNGGQEKSVERGLVRKIDKSGKDSDASRRVSSRGADSETDHEVGEMVEGNQKSRSPSKRREGLRLPSVGDRVEARFYGGRAWMAGRVSRVHRDGSYDITYGNGDRERHVPEDHVRLASPIEDSAGSDSNSGHRAIDVKTKPRHGTIMEGNRVEIRLDGWQTWEKATVTRVHSDGTYDVRCRNGEQHKRISSRRVRDVPLRDHDSPSRHDSEGSSRNETDDSHGKERGRNRGGGNGHQHRVSEKANAAATRVLRELRNAGKTVDDLKRKLERADRGQGIDRESLETVLARIGAVIPPREARDLYRSCVDIDNDDFIDLSSLISILHRGRRDKRAGSLSRRRSSSSRHHRHHSSSSSTSDVSVGAQRRSRAASRSQSTDRSSRHGSQADLRMNRTSRSRQRSPSARRGKSLRSRTGTTSESDGCASLSSSNRNKSHDGGKRLSKHGLIGLRKLEGPAFDGSLRHEFEKLSGGRGRDLPTLKLKRFLRQLRVKIDATIFRELVTILDSEKTGSISLGGLLEVALSTSEDKKVAKIHADISKQLFKPNARGDKHHNSKKAKALSASISKALVRMEQPKTSGLVLTSSLKKLLQKVGASAPSADIQALGERLDPDNHGKIDREAFVLWLTTGFDLLQAESRASRQLSQLKSTIPQLERMFREFDVHREGMVTKANFISAIRCLGLILTHGQATALAAEHHEDYERFLANSSKLGKNRSSSSVEQSSDNSDGESTDRLNRARSKVGVSGRGAYDGSSDDSDRDDTSGPKSGKERGEGENGVLLGKTARVALRDVFERACSSTGGVREAYHSVGKGSGDEDRNGQGLTSREQTQRFLRRLKLDLSKHDRTALVEALTGPQDDQPGKRRRKKRHSSQGETDDEYSAVSGVRILYRDFLELLIAEQESKEVTRVFGRMWKDLEKIADTKRTCPFTFAAKIMSKHEGEGTAGFVKASDFKRGLEKMGIGELSSKEKSLLVRRFDPNEEGMVNYELFAAWVSCGIDKDRLKEKMERLLGQLTGRESRGGKGRQEKEGEGKRAKRKSGIRAVFEAIDQDAEGTITQHDMRVVLQKELGLPLAEGDFKALFRRLDKDGYGMLDYEELFVLASTKKREGDRGKDGDNDGRGGLFSKLKRRGSALVKGAAGHIAKQHGRDMTTDDAPSDDNNSETATEAEDDEDASEMEDKDEARGKEKRRQNDKDMTKDKTKQEDNSKANGRRGITTKTSKRERRATLARIRVSILQQSADVAKEKSGDEKQCNEENGAYSNVQMDWLAMFERRDRAGSGRANIQELEAVLEEGGAHLSEDEMALLLSRFEASTVCHGDATISDKRNGGGKGEELATCMDYDAFVRWLSQGGLDNAVLLKVQWHIKGRLNKTKDLRTLFSEMCGSAKEQLSASRLAKGLRHAGLPLDRVVVDQLIEAFSFRGVRGRRLSYTEFHRMVHCDALRSGGLETMDAEANNGFAGGTRNLDEEIQSTLLDTIKQAFAFYDEDDSNSIEAAELINILRAMGHEPTRKEERALLRDADVDRSGLIQYGDFQEAVMPFLLQRTQSKRLTEGEMRAIFDNIDKNGSGLVKSGDFAYLFSRKLRLLSQREVETLLALLDRQQSGHVSWDEFSRLFELINGHVEDGGAEALNPNVKKVAAVALRRLQMGCMPDVNEQLSSFSGMPTTYRKSVLAPLDQIKDLSLQWVLMPKLDSHGCIKLQDMSVKVTTEVAEVEAPKVSVDDSGKILVKTTNISDLRAKSAGYNKKQRATMGFRRRGISPPLAAVSTSKEIHTRRRSSMLGMRETATTTTVTKHAELQEIGAPTHEGMRGWNDHERDPSGVMQVELSVKQAYGIPVPKDSRASDIRQRGMRACLFYDASGDVDRDVGEATFEYGQHFLGNTYKTLAIQHPQKEEQWLFPDSAEGERKFLVRTDFGRRVGRDQGGQKVPSHASGSKDRLFLLLELTCTVQTVKDRDVREDERGSYARGGFLTRGRGAVRGPLKQFRIASSRTRARNRGVGSESSYDNSPGEDDEPYRQGNHKDRDRDRDGESEGGHRKRGRGNEKGRRKRRIEYFNGNDESTDTATNSVSDGETAGKRETTRTGHISRLRGNQKTAKGYQGRALRGRRRSRRKVKSASPSKHDHDRTGASTHMSQDRRGIHSEGPQHRKCRGRRGFIGSGRSGYDTNSDGLTDASSEDRNSMPLKDRPSRRRGGRGDWRGPWRGLKGGGRWRSGSENRTEDVVEVEMSCGWVLIPFLDLVETQEIRRVRYTLSGGTPFAKADINEDEVMARRYGWRALLKALNIQGGHKESEIEIKILPVSTLRKAKQEDIFRLPRNIVLSDTFVSLVRYYREYAANSLARRSAKGMGNAGFGAVLGSSEPVLALFPRLTADPALMMALKNQWDAEVRNSHVDGRLGATVSAGLANIGIGGSLLTGATGAARGAVLTTAFEKAVMKLWPAYCHIDAQRRGAEGIRAESYEELETRSQKIRGILSKSDSFRSDTPKNVSHGGDRGMFKIPGKVGAFLTPDAHESSIMVAFNLKEVAFDVA